MIKRLTLITALLLFIAPTLAQHQNPSTDHTGRAVNNNTHQAAPQRSAGADRADHPNTEIHYPHPALPPLYATWSGAMLIAIAGMFVAAAVIGPVIRSDMPEEIPDAHSHDEPPGASGHHGPSGTHTPTPDHKH